MATPPTDPHHDPHHHPDPPVHEREVIVTDGGRRGPGIGGVLVAVVAIIVLVVLGLVIVNAIQGSVDEMEDGPNVEVPSDIDVDVDENGGNGGDGQ